jgi:hypothetical protein
MAFQLSPGVLVTERDLTLVVPAVATTNAGFVGDFKWGPADEIRTIDSENNLRRTFGLPDNDVAEDWFSAASFLAYGNNLQVVRVVGTSALNAGTDAGVLITNEVDYLNNHSAGAGANGTWAAKYPGALGNSLKVSMADSSDFSSWAYKQEFDAAPSTTASVSNAGGSQDEMHIIVIDEDGLFTGTAGTILERFAGVSKAANAVTSTGESNYYKNVLNFQSLYIWWTDHIGGHVNWGSDASGVTFTLMSAVTDPTKATVSLQGGANDSPTDGDLQTGYAKFGNDEEVDVSLLFLAGHSVTVGKYVQDNIATVRKDCMVFLSPQKTDVVNNAGQEAADIVTTRNSYSTTSYSVMDSGWKYMYDRYNDVYRWIPCNGDVAGLCVQTDLTNDPWWSPAGFNRGHIKNAVKMAYSPRKTDRDTLYKAGVNPIAGITGSGIVLLGDKTMLDKPSAFDRINVRRLFIVLEKAIATAAKFQLFEFNDAFTRAQFTALVEPFLRDVQARKGLYDFKVVCNENNNTPEVIDRNEFVADIFLKPAKAINFIQLNFIATRTGVSFEEVGA